MVREAVVERLSSKEEVRFAVAEARREGKTVGFVPTMGALHEGHMSLVREARRLTGVVVVSIFVNPTQFGPDEDLAAYPRDLAHDLELLAAEGVEIVFTPSVDEMYRTRSSVSVVAGPLAEGLCGAGRPDHFDGVATVVAKLFNIVQPDIAFFGEKDYQQLLVVRALVRDLDFPLRIVACPTARERDGLAMSSRNAYLSVEGRQAATVLSRALAAVQEAAARGERDSDRLVAIMRDAVAEEPLAALEYASIVDSDTLAPLQSVESGARALIAVTIGNARLIDNAAVGG